MTHTAAIFDTDLATEQQFVVCFACCVYATDTASGVTATKIGQQVFDHYENLSFNKVVFHDGAVGLTAKLNNRGIITGLITNGTEQIQLGKVHALFTITSTTLR